MSARHQKGAELVRHLDALARRTFAPRVTSETVVRFYPRSARMRKQMPNDIPRLEHAQNPRLRHDNGLSMSGNNLCLVRNTEAPNSLVEITRQPPPHTLILVKRDEAGLPLAAVGTLAISLNSYSGLEPSGLTHACLLGCVAEHVSCLGVGRNVVVPRVCVSYDGLFSALLMQPCGFAPIRARGRRETKHSPRILKPLSDCTLKQRQNGLIRRISDHYSELLPIFSDVGGERLIGYLEGKVVGSRIPGAATSAPLRLGGENEIAPPHLGRAPAADRHTPRRLNCFCPEQSRPAPFSSRAVQTESCTRRTQT